MQDSKGHRLGNYIKNKRMEKGMTGRELARRVEVDDSYIVRLEQGSYNAPRPITLQNIAAALDLPISDVYAMADCEYPTELPSFHPYLNAKYAELPVEAISSIHDYFLEVASQHGIDVGEPGPGEDEEPFTRAEDIDPRDLI